MTTFANRLREIMEIRQIRQVDIVNLCQPYCKKIGFGAKLNKSDISQYLSNKCEASQLKLYILANALNVNEAWLMGYDVPMARSDSHPDDGNLSKDEKLVLELFRMIPDEKKSLVLAMIRAALHNQ